MTQCRKKSSGCLFFVLMENVILIYLNQPLRFIFAIALLLFG
ncbi:hypothetical protein VCRA2119O430_180019 [Vibrio crassostreae]|nr:hypothetical protein VCRA2114O369_150085 [Vibrio crassostreae]CAK1791391.1 hypothetical protein VCRA2113O357_160034 [Vibrio crassostreae]CAK1797071.1 hypothetical protein VCRA2114O367_160084 [Vibrio crassostreae]CAK1805007.1 hypothetical protein VCRA2119O430_180019 [Vibrio crassostreae]CAK1859884.1 hypothetical protein VCRA2113O194_10216 [Vibrio crassostreae]